jgi:hypothetical protein
MFFTDVDVLELSISLIQRPDVIKKVKEEFTDNASQRV